MIRFGVPILAGVALLLPAPATLKPKKPARATPVLEIHDGKGFAFAHCPTLGCATARQRVPMNQHQQYDFVALRRQARKVRATYPPGDTPALRVRVVGRVPWWVVVKAMAVLRHGEDGKPLFPVSLMDLGGTPEPRPPRPRTSGGGEGL